MNHEQPLRLQWPDEPPATPPTQDKLAVLREQQRHFWLKIAPPHFDTRVTGYHQSRELDWD
jgi:hypothetical protein